MQIMEISTIIIKISKVIKASLFINTNKIITIIIITKTKTKITTSPIIIITTTIKTNLPLLSPQLPPPSIRRTSSNPTSDSLKPHMILNSFNQKNNLLV
jgi:hypothetical protein